MNSLFTFYKAGSSTDIYRSQVLPKNGSMVAIEKQVIAGGDAIKSNYSPGAVKTDKKYYLFYSGIDSGDIYSADSKDGSDWNGNKVLKVGDKTMQSSRSPASVIFNETINLIYKGKNSDTVYLSCGKEILDEDGEVLKVEWEGNSRIRVNDHDIKTSSSPSAVVFKDKLYIFYKAGSDNRIYRSHSSNDKDWENNGWEGDTHIEVAGEPIKSTNSPACTVFNGKIYLIYKGSNSNKINFAYSEDGDTWYGNYPISIGEENYIQSDNSPSCSVLTNNGKDRLCIIYKAGGSNNVYSAYSDNGITWVGDTKIYLIQTSVGPNYLQENVDTDQFLYNLLSLSPDPEIVKFNSDHEYPDLKDKDAHIQGIQTIDLSNTSFVISSSNFDLNKKEYEGLIMPINNSELLDENVQRVDHYGHAGGIQAHGDTLIVPLAKKNSPDKPSKTNKRISFYNVNGTSVTEGSRFPCTQFRDAQAAGYVSVIDSNDTKRLIFVVISQTDIKYGISSLKDSKWKVPNQWDDLKTPKALYAQSINLFSDGNSYYMIGLRFDEDGVDKDVLVPYKFTLSDTGQIEDFTCLGLLYMNGNDMRAAGGINLFEDNSVVVSTHGKTISKGSNEIKVYLNSPDI